jgi:hypothetical protein
MEYILYKKRKTYKKALVVQATSLSEALLQCKENLVPGDFLKSPRDGYYYKFDGLNFEPYGRVL